jgi:predicted MPP superfamily phosphohydrolase
MITRRQFTAGLLTAGAAGMGFGGYAFAVEPRFRLEVAEWPLVTPKWPYQRPLRIVILADIHACEPWMPAGRIRRIVEEANALGGDLILLLGDFVAGPRLFETAPVPPQEWSEALARLAAPLGVHAVLGNHDWWTNVDEVREALTAAGVEIYQNRARRFSARVPFWLAGTDSMIAHPMGGGRFLGLNDLPGTLAQITDEAPAILMAHEPDLFTKVPDRFAVTLCGHTHGGQVCLPLLGRPIVPSSYGQRFAYGHIREEGRDLIVSGGLGCSIMPVRLGVPRFITLVTLHAGGAPDSARQIEAAAASA